ncbi:GntR family transcriptional regulator [Kitasatospora humi]|uniref:GntR family transcriptional regulator n=1 Tax=Kitasatospora humi TaxID=2893891 RepID=UPI0027E0F951|nr:GntR family transcriptional regulator [Kitasatospora humi]
MSLTDQAIGCIRRLIRDGELLPGDRLPPEPQLAAPLGLSRDTMREGAERLFSARALRNRRDDGSCVTSLAPGPWARCRSTSAGAPCGPGSGVGRPTSPRRTGPSPSTRRSTRPCSPGTLNSPGSPRCCTPAPPSARCASPWPLADGERIPAGPPGSDCRPRSDRA